MGSVWARDRAPRTTRLPPLRWAINWARHLRHRHPRPPAPPPEVNFCLTGPTYRLITSSRPTRRASNRKDGGKKATSTVASSVSLFFSLSLFLGLSRWFISICIVSRIFSWKFAYLINLLNSYLIFVVNSTDSFHNVYFYRIFAMKLFA